MHRPRTSRASALDVVLAVTVAAAGSWYAVVQSEPAGLLLRSPVALQVAVQLAAAGCLLARRQRPLVVGSAVAVLCLVAPVHAAAFATYAASAYGSRRRPAVAVSVGIAVCWWLGARAWDLLDPWSVPLLITLAAVLGLYVRARRVLVEALVDRAERAEREQALLAERAVARERERLAGEMHDVVSSRLGRVVLQAGALSVRTGDEEVRREVEEIRAQGAAALTELRDVFGVLRTSPTGALGTPSGVAPRAGAPTDDGLDELVRQWHGAGLDLVRTGERSLDRLDPAAVRTACRIAEEGLTNAAKHAPGAPVTLHCEGDGESVTVCVRNAGAREVPDAALIASGGGRGLAGLSERVRLVGGSLTWGPDRHGGFALTGRLPAGGGAG